VKEKNDGSQEHHTRTIRWNLFSIISTNSPRRMLTGKANKYQEHHIKNIKFLGNNNSKGLLKLLIIINTGIVLCYQQFWWLHKWKNLKA